MKRGTAVLDKVSLMEFITFEKEKINWIITNILETDENALISNNRTIKDVIAHISYYEEKIIEAISQGPSFRDNRGEFSLEERNEVIFNQFKDHTLVEVLNYAKNVFLRLTDLITRMDDFILNDPNLIPGMPPGWLPWKGIYINTIEHYNAHRPALQKWLAENT